MATLVAVNGEWRLLMEIFPVRLGWRAVEAKRILCTSRSVFSQRVDWKIGEVVVRSRGVKPTAGDWRLAALP